MNEKRGQVTITDASGDGEIRGHDTYPLLLSFMLIFPMARLARTVVAGFPHHVTQRGNRREAIFFGTATRRLSRFAG
jgi:hypothetical protein